jgi:hypothetical protein
VATIGSLVVDIRTNTAKFVQGMNKANDHINKIEKRVRTFSRVLKGLAAIFAGFVIAGFIHSTIAAGDQINKLHDRLGASTEALSQYQYVAEKTGVSFQTLTLGWQRMTRRISEAAQGTGEATGALRELGLSAEKLNNLAPEQQFESIAKAMAGVSNQADKVRIAMKLFDTDGVALVQTMGEGAAGLQKMREEANLLGRTLSQAQANQLSKAQDAMAKLKAATGGLATTFAVNLAPAITDFVNWLSTTGIPAFARFLDNIGLIKREIDSLAKKDLLARMERTRDRIEQLNVVLRSMGENVVGYGVQAKKELEILTGQMERMRARLDLLNNPPPASLTPDTSATSALTGFTDAYVSNLQKRYDALNNELASEYTRMQQHYNDLTSTAVESYAAGISTYAEYQASMTSIAALEAQNRENIEKKYQKIVQGLHVESLSIVASILRTFAGNNKSAAIAALAIEKGIAIQRILIYANTAAMAALLPPPIGLGPVAGLPLAASIRAAGNLNAILTGIEGIAQASQIGSGGASLGSPANPVTTQPASSDNYINQTPGTVINVTVLGDNYGFDDFTGAVSDAVRSAIDNDALVVSNS